MAKIMYIYKEKMHGGEGQKEYEWIYGINIEKVVSFVLSDGSGLGVVCENSEVFVVTEPEAIEEFMKMMEQNTKG